MSRKFAIKAAVFVVCLIPMFTLLYQALSDNLGANPIEVITHHSGEWALRFLIITLAVRPLRIVLDRPALIAYRRMLGLFAFFYASLHFLTYLVLDQFFAWRFIWEDIIDRPYIIVGFISFVLLIPLALTSNKFMMRWLGTKWKKLHFLVYIIAVLAVVHFFMLTKADYLQVIIYAALLASLLIFRVIKLKPRKWLKNNF